MDFQKSEKRNANCEWTPAFIGGLRELVIKEQIRKVNESFPSFRQTINRYKKSLLKHDEAKSSSVVFIKSGIVFTFKDGEERQEKYGFLIDQDQAVRYSEISTPNQHKEKSIVIECMMPNNESCTLHIELSDIDDLDAVEATTLTSKVGKGKRIRNKESITTIYLGYQDDDTLDTIKKGIFETESIEEKMRDRLVTMLTVFDVKLDRMANKPNKIYKKEKLEKERKLNEQKQSLLASIDVDAISEAYPNFPKMVNNHLELSADETDVSYVEKGIIFDFKSALTGAHERVGYAVHNGNVLRYSETIGHSSKNKDAELKKIRIECPLKDSQYCSLYLETDEAQKSVFAGMSLLERNNETEELVNEDWSNTVIYWGAQYRDTTKSITEGIHEELIFSDETKASIIAALSIFDVQLDKVSQKKESSSKTKVKKK